MEGAWERAIDYLSDLRSGNPSAGCVETPPAAAYAAAANACARAGQGLRARALIAELAELAANNGGSGEKPTIECYNAVIAGCAIAGDIDGALRTLKEEIPKAGLRANTKSYNHLLAGCARSGRWETALVLLQEQRSGERESRGRASARARSRADMIAECFIRFSVGVNDKVPAEPCGI